MEAFEIFNIVLMVAIIVAGVVPIGQTIRADRAYKARRAEIDDHYRRLTEEFLRMAREAKYKRDMYPKCHSLDEQTRNKIMKIAQLAVRGVRGEKDAAISKFNTIIAKHGLTIKDIPSVEI